MDYKQLDASTLYSRIEEKRSELNALIEQSASNNNHEPSEQILGKSQELDTLITLHQQKSLER